MLSGVMNLFGGKAAREGFTSSIAVKGNRKVVSTANVKIIDLGAERVYAVDLRKKSYKVTTFAEMRREMEEAQRKAPRMREIRKSAQNRARAKATGRKSKSIST